MDDDLAGKTHDDSYDSHEVDLILRAASQTDRPPRAIDVAVEGLTLAEIQEIGAQVGIDRHAITSASLAIRLESGTAAEHRLHFTQVIPGELPAAAWDRLVDLARSGMGSPEVRRSDGSLEIEVSRKSGELGKLLLSIRSRDGITTIGVWSDGPHMSTSELALCGLVGMAVPLFPVVAMSGGVWPAAGLFAGLAALGAGLGSGAAIAWQRRASERWRNRVVALLTPIVSEVSSLAVRSSEDEVR